MDENTASINDCGLCSTCNHKTDCVTLQFYKGKILQCEEFETHEVKSENINQIEPENSDCSDDTENYFGICKNCELRKNCLNYNPDKIIWHCEEYV